MDTRFLASLLAVVDTGSIAAAARQQGITSAALSGRIKTLETQLDTQLLSRSAHAATPTTACFNLLPRAKDIVNQAQLLKADGDASGLSSSLFIGCIDTALIQYIPPIIRSIKQQAPNASLSIKPGSSQQLYDLLCDRKIDAAITTAPQFKLPKSIRSVILANQQLVLICKKPSDQPLKTQLQNNPFIAYDKSSWGGGCVSHALEAVNFKTQILCELDSFEAIAQLVDEDLGITILPEWEGLYKHFKHLSITPISHFGYNLAKRQITFLTHNSSEPAILLEIAKNSIID